MDAFESLFVFWCLLILKLLLSGRLVSRKLVSKNILVKRININIPDILIYKNLFFFFIMIQSRRSKLRNKYYNKNLIDFFNAFYYYNK